MKLIGGFWWPDEDVHAAKVILNEVSGADEAIKLCKQTKVVVQAGGNVGVWPKYLASTFGEVWTFEPDLENYLCLLHNVPQNVFRFNSALGHKRTGIEMDRQPDNCGAHQVNLGGGPISMLTIDDLGLKACDLIQLDIEGFEPLALDGAKETIKKFKPVLMLEDKDISRRYGYRQGWPERDIPGYDIVARVRNDVILVHR